MDVEFYQKFFYIYWDDCVAFILQVFFNVMYHTGWFVNTEKPLNSWDKSYLIMVYDPFNVLLDLVAIILLRTFASVFISDPGL